MIRQAIARLWRWVRRKLGLASSAPTIPPAHQAGPECAQAPEPPLEHRPPARPRRQHARFRRDILGKLDAYQTYARRMRRSDPDAFAQYARLGAYVIPRIMEIAVGRLEPRVLETLPGFGAIAIGVASDVDPHQPVLGPDGLAKVPVRFMYFERLRRVGPAIQRMNQGTCYRLTAYCDDADDPRLRAWGTGGTFTYAVQVMPDGQVIPLRVLKRQRQIIHHRHGRARGTTTISHQRWGLPDTGSDNPAEIIQQAFIIGANFWSQAAEQSMIRVTATRDGLTMPFVVDALATKHVFADRDVVRDAAGNPRRIFHVVRTHRRVTGQVVRLHFRGLRKFDWNGYQVSITVPGRDQLSLADWSVPGDVFDDDEVREGYVTMPKAADMIADWIGAPPGPAAAA